MKNIYFKDLLRYRSVWLGFAMIWVVLYHCPIKMPLDIFTYVKGIGYGGVDICLFASGIGCYYSLSKNSDVGQFMKRRFQRLIPTYWIFLVFWFIYQFIEGKLNYRMAIGNVFAVQSLTNHEGGFNWYISAIFLFYLFAPYFKAIVDSESRLVKVSTLIFLLVGTIPFWESEALIILVTRIEIFFIGMMFGSLCKKDVMVSKKHIIIGSGMLIVGLSVLLVCCLSLSDDVSWMYGFFWYPFIFIAPPLSLIISYVSMLLEKTKATQIILKGIATIGENSFEVYLIHLPLVVIVNSIIGRYGLSGYNWLIWSLFVVVLFICCFLLKKVANMCSKHLFGIK